MVGLTDTQLEERLRAVLAEKMPDVVAGAYDEHLIARQVRPTGRRIVGVVAAAAMVVAASVVVLTIATRHDPVQVHMTTPTSAISATVAPSSTVAPAVQELAPIALPDGWKVWRVSRISRSPDVQSRQLFGRFDASGHFSGIYLTIDPEPQGASAASMPTSVRGQSAIWADDGLGTQSLAWTEQGLQVVARFRQLSVDEATSLLDSLTWRADPLLGFEPPASGAAPLVSEDVGDAPRAVIETYFGIVPVTGPTFSAGSDSVTVVDHQVLLSVAQPTRTLVGLDPEVAFSGTLQADGSVLESWGPSARARLARPDGTVVTVEPMQTADEQLALLTSIAPTDASTVRRIALDESDLLAALPTISEHVVGDDRIVLRGDAAARPTAMCLVVGDAQRCRPYFIVTPSANLGWVAGISIDGGWYLYGHTGPDADEIAVVPWSADLRPGAGTIVAPLSMTTTTDADGQRWWVVHLPDDGPDDVTILDTTTGTLDHTTAKQAYHRTAWD